MRAALVAFVLAFVCVPVAYAATPTAPVYDSEGRVVETPFAPVRPPAALTEKRATDIFLHHPKVVDWLKRYPKVVRYDAAFDEEYRYWQVHVWSGDAGEVATGRVDDASGVVTEAWTGPQVAWKMARGGPGAFGGEKTNDPTIWLGLCALFLLGLADLRRPLSVRNLDLLALLSFSVSLWFFNRGDIFTSVPLVYPPLLYLLARTAWIGWRGRVGGSAARPVWPVWALVGATVFLAGFRIGLNVQTSNVIDVGYAGVIGAERILDGRAPYGNFPRQGDLKPCGPADAEGEIRERIQDNGRCEASNEFGDTYGPVSYAAYVPAYLVFGWTGKWDDLPTAHATAILFDLLCLAGLGLVGLRYGGRRLAATLAFAWAAFPFTLYVSSSNTNDAIFPAFLIFGFLLASSAWKRGALCALAGWTKFASFVVAPLWLTYDADGGRRRPLLFTAGFAVASALALSVLLLEPSPVEAARTFVDRTVVTQVTRESPFSLWDWGQYRAAGIPDLGLVQLVLEAVLVAAGIAVAFVPRRKSPLQLAALTAALLVAFEFVLTHWFYLYIPWFFPFVAVAVLSPAVREPAAQEAAEPSGREARELVATA
ncbi:MAG: hypothetical protein M3321_10020 [Actinomycetota bacterium]|nr:hypothetical protein [Actinomycetota bacterium]